MRCSAGIWREPARSTQTHGRVARAGKKWLKRWPAFLTTTFEIHPGVDGRPPEKMSGTGLVSLGSTCLVTLGSNDEFCLRSLADALTRRSHLKRQERNGRDWIRTSEGISQQIYSLLSNRVNLTFTGN